MLIVPESFSKDPRAYLFNQLGHMAGGFALVYVVILAWAELYATVPFKSVAVAMSIALYVLIVELPQGWRKFDTVEDTMFVTYGAVATVLAFDALEGVAVEFNPPEGAGVFVTAGLHLGGGVLWRYLDRKLNGPKA